MPYTVALPDGRTVEFPDSVSREEAAAIIRRQLGVGAQPKESTIFGEIARGGKQLASTSRTGIGALASPEEAARAGVERSQQIAAEAGEGPSFAALRKVYEERGLLPAAGELVSQIPRAVAGQLPQLAAMAGGAKLGAMAGSVVPGVGTIAGGVLGAGATLLPQFFGANVERQAAEQMERGEQVKIDRGAAAAAAAGQAGIESVGTALVLGKRVVKGILGVADDAGLATAKARADLVKAAERSRLGAAGRGAAVGVAEIPVEIAQAVIERAQAGLDVMSPEAFTEYGENAYLAGLVGPTIGAATRVTEPGAARKKLAAEEQAKAVEERAAAAKAETERKKDPAYALQLDADYQAAVQRMKELQAAVPKRPAKDALPEEQMAYRQAVDARNAHLKDVLQPLAAEYVPRKAEIAQLKEQQRVAGMSEEEYADYSYEQALKRQPKTAPIAEKPEELSADFADIAPPTPAPKPAPVLAYAQRQVQLANDNEAIDRLDTKDQAAGYVSYLMQDPEMARRLVTAQTPIPGVKKSVSNTVLGGLKLQLKAYDEQQRREAEASRPDLYGPGETADTFAPWKQSIEAEERLREEEATAVAPVRKEEAVISPEREEQIKALETARQRYRAAADTYLKAKGTPDGPRALQQLLAARKEYESFAPAPLVGQAPAPVLSPETEAQLDKALAEVAGEAPASAEELESRIQRLADTRKTAIAKVSENASELAQYEKLTQYMGTPQGLSEVARTPEMAEAAKRRMTPMLEQAQASRNEAIAAAIQEIRLQRDASGLVPLDKSDADLQNEFRAKLNADLQQAKGKAKVDEKKRQEAIAQQLQRINTRIRQIEGGDRAGRLLGYASAFRSEPERVGELNNLYKAYRSLSTQQGLTPQAAQLNRTLQNLVDFYTVGSGAAKPRVVAKGPREARRELVLGERAFTGYEPTVEGTEVRYNKPRKMAEYKATPEEQALVEDMRARELAELNEAADQQYTPETSDRVKKQIFDALRQRIDNISAPATQEEVDAAKAQAAPQDQATGDLFAAATERAQAELQAAGERRAAARSEVGRAMAGMRGKSAVMDQAQRLAEKFGKDLGIAPEGTFAAAKTRLTQAQAAKRGAETEFKEKEQEALRAAADDALIAQRNAEATSRAANNTVDAIEARLAAEKETPAVEVRTPPRAMVLLQKIVELQALIGGRGAQVRTSQAPTKYSPAQFVFRRAAADKTDADVGPVQDALNQAVSAAKQGEGWASDIEQVQAHMATLEKYLSRREAQGRLLPEAELMAKEWYRKLAAHEAALRRPMYGAGQLTPAEIRDYTQRRLELAQAEYDRIQLQIDGLHRQLLDTEVAVAKREVDRITGDINALVSRMERREGADLAGQELSALSAQYKDAVANLEVAQKTFAERKKAESVPFTRKSPGSALEQWMKGAQDRFDASVQRFKDKQAALERQATAPAATPAITAAERRAEVEKQRSGLSIPELQAQLEGALKAQTKLKKRGSKKQREALAEKIAGLRAQIGRLKGESTFGTEYYAESEQAQAAQDAREEAEAREAGKEETTRAGRRKAAKEIFGVQRTIAETGEVPQATKDANKLDAVIKNNRQAFEMAVEQGFKSTAIRPQKRGKSATPERLMRTPLEGIAYRLRQEIVEKLAAPRTKKQNQELNRLREQLYGLEQAINTAPVTVEERRRTARAIWAKLPKDMRQDTVDKLGGRLPSGGISTSFFDRFADALETTVIRQRLGQPISQAPVTTMTKAELAPIQAETEKRVSATLKATEELRTKYYAQKEKELSDKARLKGTIDEATQRQIEKEATEFADRVVQRIKEEEAREATQRMTEPMRGKPRAGEDIEFSRGTTESPSTTASVRTELSKAFPDLSRVQIYDSVDALVAANPQYEGRIPSDARGFVDTAGNKAFLIAENINKGDALAVLLHEVGAHIGLKNMLGTAQYNALVKAVETWAKKNDGSVESRVAKTALERVEAAKTPANQKADETLAYAIEEAVKAGVKPMETKGALGQWLSQIATLFRKALEKFGLPAKSLDAQGLVDMAFGAAKLEMRGQGAAAPTGRRGLLFAKDAEQTTFYSGPIAALGPIKNPTAVLWTDGESILLQIYDQDLINEGVKPSKAQVETVELEIKDNGKTAALHTYGVLPSASATLSKYKDQLTKVKAEGVKRDPYYKFNTGAFSVTDLRKLFRVVRDQAIDLRMFDDVEKVEIRRATGATAGMPPRFIEREDALRFSRNLPTASRVADSLIAKEKGWLTKLKDNFLGMGGRTQFVDKLAPSEEALKRGGTDPTKALQAMYYLRMYDQRMHFTSQSITEGVPELVEKTRRDGTTERLIETKPGANIQQIVDILKGKDVVKAAGSPDAANKLFTLYLAAIRGERVGYDTLNFGRVWAEAEVKRIDSQLKATTISQEQRAVLQKRKKSLEEKIPTMPTAADIKAARAEIEADPTLKKAFDEARDIYNQYNRNLLEFSVQTGALSRAQANEYLSNNDYIPYYRMRDGVAEMVIGGETPIRIGNLKDSPHLKELVGGDEAIFDFLTSSVQNTSMLLDMATKNLATKNLMFELRDVGLATVAKVPKSGKTPEGAVTFKRDGEDHYAVVDTDAIGIDSDLLVKGLAGIPTMFPAFVRVLGVPARLLRRVVVASPVYMARQLVRDSLAAAMTSGADIVPVLSALKQIGKPNALQSRGITGGQVFTGMPEDVTRMLKDMQAGKISVTNGLSYLEAKAAQVDALTRKAQYDSYLAQGLSEMEATYMALESMNFSKRGLSPTMHMVSTLIPFFNAQIQGLDVLYKSFTGQMPLNERLAIREKLWTRGLMLAGLSMAYALAMQDDETYKNAKPEEKYGNWFVQVPGFEQMVRLPIPFELGYIFKALPEALVNTLSTDQGGEDAMKAFKHIAQQMVPGASSYFLPQAVKPALETLIGTSLYTGRSIESTQEQMMEPGYRYRDNTTEAAKFVGELTGFSPVKMEFLIRGYTGSMGMALLAALSAPFGGEGPEAATKRASDMPVVGTLFQPKDASGIIDATYERMQQVNQVKETYEGLLNKGRQADAEKYLKENIDEMALASVAGSFKQYMGQITEYERQIRASSLTPEKKREALDQARQAKIQLATSVRAATDRKAPQAAPA